jgi:uncharacterized protein YycO
MKVAFYKGTGWISKGILYISRGGYSHAAVQLNDGSIIEAHARRGVCTRKDLLDQVNTTTQVVVFDVQTTPEQDVIIEQFLKAQIGKGYDYWSIVGFIVHSTHEGRSSYGRWFCSELVFAAFQKAGINLLERVECWKVSPTILSFSPLLGAGKRYQLKMRTAKQIAM